MAEPWLICFFACNREMQPFSFFFCWLFVGGGGTSGRVRALNLTVPLGSGRVGSDNLGYGPGSGFSFEPVQTSNIGTDLLAACASTNHPSTLKLDLLKMYSEELVLKRRGNSYFCAWHDRICICRRVVKSGIHHIVKKKTYFVTINSWQLNLYLLHDNTDILTCSFIHHKHFVFFYFIQQVFFVTCVSIFWH